MRPPRQMLGAGSNPDAIVAAFLVVCTTLFAFLAGALQHPWWLPLVVAPPAVWGYARVVAPAYRLEERGPSRYAEAVLTQVIDLYLAFALGWFIAVLFG